MCVASHTLQCLTSQSTKQCNSGGGARGGEGGLQSDVTVVVEQEGGRGGGLQSDVTVVVEQEGGRGGGLQSDVRVIQL